MSRALRVHIPGLAAGVRRLPAEAAHYVARVHRLVSGDRFIAFDPEAAIECDVSVTQIGNGHVTCAFAEARPAALVGQLPLTLLQAPSKADRFEDVVRAATALGVRRLELVTSERSVFVPNAKHRERLRAIAIDGARQSGRGDLPSLGGPTALGAALSMIDAPLRVCLHPRASVPLVARLRDWTPAMDVAVLIGPEGGFSDDELGAIEGAGFELCALGPLILRAELAAVVALGCFAASLPGAGPDEGTGSRVTL
jgi:16S rRNA (uracil1498-N3)-methyltransferase